MKLLILTVGLPRSGKSTWARQQTDCVIIEPDAIRLAVYGQAYRAEVEDHIWGIAQIMARALFISGHEKVIVDATNINKSARDKWKRLFPEVRVVHKLFTTDKKICIERARKGGRTDLIPVIERMAKHSDTFGLIKYKNWERTCLN